MQEFFSKDEQFINALVEGMSKPRLSKYLEATKGNPAKSLEIYHWNSLLSQSLYFPLQTWEILLRNRLNDFFVFKYEKDWPFNEKANRNFAGNDRKRVADAIERLQRASKSKPSTGQIVADLSAGFWVSQFGRNYEVPYGWRNNLKFKIFVADHSLDRELVADMADDLLDLRNRVAHHEPIFCLPLDELRKDLGAMVYGMCPQTAEYLDSFCSFQKIWEAKPEI